VADRSDEDSGEPHAAAASSAGTDGASIGSPALVSPSNLVLPARALPAAGRRTLGEDLANRIRIQVADRERPLSQVRALGLTVVTLDDSDYPERLRRVDMPPPLLFVRGSVAALSASAAVAVVGTRWPSDKGRMIAGWIASSLARAEAVVVSGLAVGIDGAAHASVVAEGKPTVAVLGGGHARLFPKAHERLADAIVDSGGAVVAELPPDTPATRGTFPRRNRLVSGLSDATVVVEAGRRSGALITAGWALEQGRECFLVPGPLDAPTSEGCHAFLRSFPGQARVVCGVPELLEDLGLAGDIEGSGGQKGGDGTVRPGSIAARGPNRAVRPAATMPGAGPGAALATLAPVERSIAEILCSGPATADDLARRTGLAGAAILGALTLLELRGLVVGAYGRYMPAGPLARWPGRPGTGRT
jgi:DNA processing protein